MVHHISQSILWKDWIALFEVRVTTKVYNFNECWGYIQSWSFCNQTYGDTSPLNIIWWHIILSWSDMQRLLVAVFWDHLLWGLLLSKYDFSLSLKLLIHFQSNLVWWYIIISRRILWTDWIAEFKVKVTVKLHDGNLQWAVHVHASLGDPDSCLQDSLKKQWHWLLTKCLCFSLKLTLDQVFALLLSCHITVLSCY